MFSVLQNSVIFRVFSPQSEFPDLHRPSRKACCKETSKNLTVGKTIAKTSFFLFSFVVSK